MSDLWNSFRDLFVDALELLHGLFRFVGDEPAWGFAIIALTLFVRILMLPLAIKQTRSMRGMQELQPQIKAIQKKYKADRELLRKDPERYKAQRQKMNQELTALYQDSGVNPMGGCLPLLAQAPVFFALFTVLRAPLEDHPAGTALGDLLRSDFYFFTPSCDNVTAEQFAEGIRCGLATGANAAGIAGILLILAMAGSMFYAQRQMLAKSLQVAEGPQLQQQKILMYVMPVFLAVISFAFPVGVLLYWATTNMWQVAQQAIILREVQHAADDAEAGRTKGKGGKGTPPSGKGGKGTPPRSKGGAGGQAGGKGSSGGKGGSKGSGGKGGSSATPGKTGSPKPAKGGSGKGKGGDNGTPPSPTGKKGSGSGSQGPAKGAPGSPPSSNGGDRKRSRGASDHLPSRRSRRDRD